MEISTRKIDLVNFQILHADARPLPAGKEAGGAELGRRITDRPSAYYGYFFSAVPQYEDADGQPRAYNDGKNRNASRYGICAYPEKQGPTFIIDERREVWEKDTSGQPVELMPARPGQDGWKRIR